MKNEKFEIIAKTLQGLEDILAQEIAELGGEDIEIGKREIGRVYQIPARTTPSAGYRCDRCL